MNSLRLLYLLRNHAKRIKTEIKDKFSAKFPARKTACHIY